MPKNEPERCPDHRDEPCSCVRIGRLITEMSKGKGRPLMTIRTLQKELAPWVEKNFGKRPAWQPLLGIVEEVGELAHSHLKQEQKIRGTDEEHVAKARDAVGDVLIFLADYCNSRGWDMQEIMEETWGEVRERDWTKTRPTPL